MAASWLLTSTGTEASVFMANGVSFLFVIAGLFIAQTRYKIPRELEERKSLVMEFREGLAYIRRNSLVASIILMAALVGFFGFPLIQQIPALARDVLKTASDTETIVAARTSLLYAAQGGGALVAAILAAYMNASPNKGLMVTLGQIAFIIPLIALGYVPSLNISLVLLVFIGWGTVTQLVSMNTLIQIKVPDGLRGPRIQRLFVGTSRRGTLWESPDRLDGSKLGSTFCCTHGWADFLVSIGGLHLISPGVRRAQA